MLTKNHTFIRIVLSTITLILLSVISSSSVELKSGNDSYRLKVFYTVMDFQGWDAVLKGEVISIGARGDSEKNDLMKIVQDRTKATVRLYNREGIKIGDTLFVINMRNLIIAKMKVISIFKTESFGYILIGHGNLRLAKVKYRIVQRVGEESAKYAYIYKSRGDYHNKVGNTGKSISYYKRAIELDSSNPEAHLYLGLIYLKKGLLQFSLKEFDKSYEEIRRLYDNEDKYLLLKGMVETRYRGIMHYGLSMELRNRFKNEGIRYSREALEIYPDSREVNFFLAMFYFIKPDPSDIDAKKQFLKVVEIDPKRVEAYVNLAVLYKKHKNDEKSEYFAKKAINIDPANRRARHILKLLD